MDELVKLDLLFWKWAHGKTTTLFADLHTFSCYVDAHTQPIFI